MRSIIGQGVPPGMIRHLRKVSRLPRQYTTYPIRLLRSSNNSLVLQPLPKPRISHTKNKSIGDMTRHRLPVRRPGSVTVNLPVPHRRMNMFETRDGIEEDILQV